MATARWQQWLLRRQLEDAGQPGWAAPVPAAAAAAAAPATRPGAAAGGSSDHASALSSSSGPSASHSAPGSTAGSGEPVGGGGGKPPVGRSSLGLPSGPGSSCYTVEPGEDELWDAYGADALMSRSAWRRTETWLAAYILAALLLALGINIGVGASNSARRGRVQVATLAYARPPPLPLQTWPPPQPSMPALPPPLPAQQLPPPPALLPPPSPAALKPVTPPANCDTAPAALARERYSGATAVFPADSAHYAANSVPGAIFDTATGARYPAYYNGAVPANCIVQVEAVYTCPAGDQACNQNADQAVLNCQAGCGSQRDCSNVAGMAGHPMALRACGLLGRAQPGCSASGLSAAGLQQATAVYKLNLCMAPPGMATPSPPPPVGAVRRAA